MFYKLAEDDGVADFPESLEHLCPQVRVLNHITQLGAIVTKHTWKNNNGFVSENTPKRIIKANVSTQMTISLISEKKG